MGDDMKQADVLVGGQYLTRVSGELVLVEVIRRAEETPGRLLSIGRTTHVTRFRVRRVDEPAGMCLPKALTAAALRLP